MQTLVVVAIMTLIDFFHSLEQFQVILLMMLISGAKTAYLFDR